jgi:hypothetical protein
VHTSACVEISELQIMLELVPLRLEAQSTRRSCIFENVGLCGCTVYRLKEVTPAGQEGITSLSHSTAYRHEVCAAVTMKNAVFWNMKTQFLPQKKTRLRYRAQAVNAI